MKIGGKRIAAVALAVIVVAALGAVAARSGSAAPKTHANTSVSGSVKFWGIWSAEEQTAFEKVIEEIATAILGFGCRALFVLDTGISTRAPVDRAMARLAADNLLHLKIHEGPRYRRAASELAEQGHGTHADELETSVMLALAPHLVNMARAEASPVRKHETPGPMTPSDPSSPNYSRSGSYGDPTLATPAKGKALLGAMVDDLCEQVAAHLATRKPAGRTR